MLAAKLVACEFTKVTLFAFVIPTPPANTFEALAREILFADPAAKVAAPVTFNALVCVNAPAVVTPSVPATDPTFNTSAFESCNCRFLTLAILTELKLLPALLRVILLFTPADRAASPLTTTPAD